MLSEVIEPARKARIQGGYEDVLNFPLIAANNTGRSLRATDPKGENVYFGTGVVTPKAISQGLPFDFLGMLLTAAWMQKQTGAAGIIHEISDTHALTNPIHDPVAVDRIARQQKEQVTELALRLGISGYRCVLASEYRGSGVFKEMQAEVDRASAPGTVDYVRYQSAGNLYFARCEGVKCKVGWLVEDDEKAAGFDERAFNNAYDQLRLDPICFVYTWSGRNFDMNRQRVSPYTSVAGERRFALATQEAAADEFCRVGSECTHTKTNDLVFKHLARIVTAFDAVVSPCADVPSIWADNVPPNGPSFFSKISKPEPWINGAYIDLDSLFQRIDVIRTVSAPQSAPRFGECGQT